MVLMTTHDSEAAGLLDPISSTFGLSETELAELFSVRRPSLSGWREHGIPPARHASVERLNDLAGVFAREIIASRIPEVVRTADDWLDGRTILETIRRDGPAPVYAYLSRLFSYAE